MSRGLVFILTPDSCSRAGDIHPNWGEVMFRSFLAVVVVGWLLSAGAVQGRGSAGLDAWFIDSLVKVFPDDVRGTHGLRSPEFSGARNQHLSVQLAIRSSRPLPTLTVEVNPLEGGAGRRISTIEVHRVAYVVVGSHTPDSPPEELVGSAPGWYPDPLEDLPFDLEAPAHHADLGDDLHSGRRHGRNL